MSSTTAIELVKGLYAAFGRGDLDSILAQLTDDVDWAVDTASTGAPWYGVRANKTAVAAFFDDIGKTVDISDFTPVSYAGNDSGDVFAIVRWAWTARETGKTATMQLHHWWRVTNGKVSYFRGAEDVPTTLNALS